ncbi:DUF3617 family protein [Brevundimonas sp.]|uniref:DUF3617 domain-containing protein n=1 Tax=Brevundimonas sp. TaxID=1871086 RepID=UPI002737AE48|nr:DUF3617 family protein [Brevundimonas sp.]MDP3801566.1 DUF3617 family protein [Brevundimonas sp.]
MRTHILFAGAAALMLAACGSGGEAVNGDKADEAAAPSVAGLPDGPTPGLWRVTMQVDGLPEGMAAPVVETCMTDEKFESPQDPASQMPGMTCSNQSFRREGDAMVGHSICTSDAGVRTQTDMRVSGDFSRRYTMVITSTTTPTPAPEPGTRTMTMMAERLGDCPVASAAQ